jgi:general stress protein 26
MADNNGVERVWALAEKISICMLSTWDGQEIHSRPMGAYVRRDNNTICFLTDARRHKDDEIRRFPTVTLAFADPNGQKYVSLIGRAEVSNDRAKIKDLWSTPAKAWWDSPDDPDIRVLEVSPQSAEYWDSPGTVVSYASMAMAAMSGSRPNLGDNRKVSM